MGQMEAETRDEAARVAAEEERRREAVYLSRPLAPAIGGDSHEVAGWLRRSEDHYRGFRMTAEADAIRALRERFAEYNPETAK